MTTGQAIRAVVLGSLFSGLAAPVTAFDAVGTFQPGRLILSLEGGGGNQENLEGHRNQTDLDLIYLGARVGILPFGPTGSGPLLGALELGLEPFYQRYVEPVTAYWAGLAMVGRYHLLSLGRLVPYLEAAGAAGGTDLRVAEVDSDFAFLLFGGVGASLFVTTDAALYAGYRLTHVSNGNIDEPNRGLEAHTGVVGVSWFFK